MLINSHESSPPWTPSWFPCKTCPSHRRCVTWNNVRFGFGGRFHDARCHMWGNKFPERWDYSAGTKNRAWWMLTRTLRPSDLPSTSPTKSLRNIGLCGPRRISTVSIALHLTLKQAHVFQFCVSVHHSIRLNKIPTWCNKMHFYYYRLSLHVSGVMRPSSGV